MMRRRSAEESDCFSKSAEAVGMDAVGRPWRKSECLVEITAQWTLATRDTNPRVIQGDVVCGRIVTICMV